MNVLKKSFEFNELVSVVMSVYNTDIKYLDTAIKSILSQSYSNFEFIIIDDGSNEQCKEYLREIDDNRVIIITNEKNIGLAASLNKGINIAKGKYIFRMDADDISLKDRFRYQIEYMEKHKDIDVLSSRVLTLEDGRITGASAVYWNFDSEEFSINLSFGPMSFPHPATVFRKEFLNDNGLRYNETYNRAQDYNLWMRCSRYGKLFVLPKILLIYRDDKKNITNLDLQNYFSDKTKIEFLNLLNQSFTEKEKMQYTHLKNLDFYGDLEDNIELIKKLCHTNRNEKKFNEHKYEKILYFWIARKSFYRNNCNERQRLWCDSYTRKKMIEAILLSFIRYVIGQIYRIIIRLYIQVFFVGEFKT